MEHYIKSKKVGEGTYGIVYHGIEKPHDNVTQEREVAIKKIRLTNRKEGVSFTGIREMKVLQELKHANIVEVSLGLAAMLSKMTTKKKK